MKIFRYSKTIVTVVVFSLLLSITPSFANTGKRPSAVTVSLGNSQTPSLLKRVKPYIPPKANESAMCCAEFIVNPKGRPSDIAMSCTENRFGEIATIALKKWRYETPRAGAKPKAGAVFFYKIYARGNKRTLFDSARILENDAGEIDFKPSRVCPILAAR